MPVKPTAPEPELGWTLLESRFNRYSPDTSGGEPSLGSLEGINQEKWADGGIADLERDTADDEPSLGATEVRMPPPEYRLGGGHGHCLFPALYREPGAELKYSAAGFHQLTWGEGARDDREDEHDGTEPCCEDEGAQCDDEGAQWIT
jgi:hypothetical protein